MSKFVILRSFALFFCIVLANKADAQNNELIDICKSINDPKQPQEVASSVKECNDLLQGILSKKGAKEDAAKIRFLGGLDLMASFSFHSTAAMNSMKNRLREDQYAVMLKINGITRESSMKFNQAADEFNSALKKKGGKGRFKNVDALLTKAGEGISEFGTLVNTKFATVTNSPELRQAMEAGAQLQSAVSRIKKEISQL